MPNAVATWEVPHENSTYKIQFDHGTTSGRRVVHVNDKEVVRKDWLFKLVGSEFFEIGEEDKIKCEIIIKSMGGFNYQYILLLDGLNITEFPKRQLKKYVFWEYSENNINYEVSLNKENLNVTVNNIIANVENIFTDDGTEINFSLNENKKCSIKVVSSGKKKEGIIYNLFVDNEQIPEKAA